MNNEALERYSDLVSPRTVAVYQVGAQAEGLRALVVTSRVGIDNPFYYSVQERLPHRFAQQFAAEPLVVPGWSVRALQHWSRPEMRLVRGHDIARSLPAIEGESESLCRALEAYCCGSMANDALAALGDIDVERAQRLLHGDVTHPALDPEHAFERTRLIEGYFHDLASMGFRYGAIFPAQAYPHAVRAAESTTFLHNVVRNFYQVRRRIEDYVA